MLSKLNQVLEIIFQGEGPDWQDFVGIVCLLIINSTISFIEENNAGNAAAALMARLAPKTKVIPSHASAFSTPDEYQNTPVEEFKIWNLIPCFFSHFPFTISIISTDHILSRFCGTGSGKSKMLQF